MAINLPSICIALKDASSCKAALVAVASLKAYFGSKVKVLVIGNNLAGLPIDYQATSIGSVKEITKNFKSDGSDLLILPLMFGDTAGGLVSAKEANNIIGHIERLVLTIPCTANTFNFKNIIVPIDTSSETRQKVPYAVSFAKAFGGTLHVFGVSSDKGKDAEVLVNNYVRQVCNNISEKGIPCTSSIQLGGNPTELILAYAKVKNADLITIMTEQETNIISLFSGKYSEQMIKNSTVPVLSIHPKDLIVSDARL
ncbi:MAG: universal stress protein [Bacteroidetes bacterium]|jgi:nucleotide-binding universal stress UspA family protein|nr:universal stress protein [Bacteroidota bacterium]